MLPWWYKPLSSVCLSVSLSFSLCLSVSAPPLSLSLWCSNIVKCATYHWRWHWHWMYHVPGGSLSALCTLQSPPLWHWGWWVLLIGRWLLSCISHWEWWSSQPGTRWQPVEASWWTCRWCECHLPSSRWNSQAHWSPWEALKLTKNNTKHGLRGVEWDTGFCLHFSVYNICVAVLFISNSSAKAYLKVSTCLKISV